MPGKAHPSPAPQSPRFPRPFSAPFSVVRRKKSYERPKTGTDIQRVAVWRGEKILQNPFWRGGGEVIWAKMRKFVERINLYDGMKQPWRYLLPGILLLLLVAGLGGWFAHRKLEQRLRQAEAWSEAEPERSLRELEALPPRGWWAAEHRARRALLYSRALDRNFVDLQSDSLIRPAVEYYRTGGELRYRMMSNYYLGRVLQNGGRLPEAAVAFTRAEEFADSLGDNHFGGLITHALSHISHAENNLKEELRYSRKSYEHFLATGREERIRYALWDLANAHYNNHHSAQAGRCYEELAARASAAGDSLYWGEALLGLASVRLQQGLADEALALFERVRDEWDYPRTVDWLTDYAFASALIGDHGRADRCMDEAEAVAADERERMRVIYRRYQIDTLRGNYSAAFDRYRVVADKQDSITLARLEQSSLVARSKHYERETAETALTLERQRNRVRLWAMLLLFVLLPGIGVLLYRSRQRARAIERYMEQITSLREHLRGVEGELNRLDGRAAQQLKARFESMNRLAETYYAHFDSAKEQERIYRQVKSDLEQLGSTDYSRETLEPLINQTMGGFMARLRAQVPTLREEEYQLATYLLLGFSYPSISIFISRRVSTLYTRVSRLKEQIAASGAPDREEFLRQLNKK